MKAFSSVFLGLGLTVGLAATVQAAPVPQSPLAESEMMAVDRDWSGHPHHPCHGASAGTADAACGSLTGGPSGGLF